jgi:hypothetical protein
MFVRAGSEMILPHTFPTFSDLQLLKREARKMTRLFKKRWGYGRATPI